MRRNEIAKLSKNAEFGCGWSGVSFFHLCRVTELKNHSNHFFLCFNQDSIWDGCGILQLSFIRKADLKIRRRRNRPQPRVERSGTLGY
jgi:hypothetical protein